MSGKLPLRIVERHYDGRITFEASFWDGPSAPGETGRYYRRRFSETRETAARSTCSFKAEMIAAFGGKSPRAD